MGQNRDLLRIQKCLYKKQNEVFGTYRVFPLGGQFELYYHPLVYLLKYFLSAVLYSIML